MATKLHGFSEEEFNEKVNPANVELINEFLKQSHLSPQTLKQYRSALFIFAKWVHDECRNKPIPSLKSRDALKYQNFLIESGMSSSGIKFKRSAVSSLFNYIEVYWDDEYPNCRNIFTKAIPNVTAARKKEKVPLTTHEIDKLIRVLTEEEEWQKLAYLLYTYITGCRREESRQLLKEVAAYKKHVNQKGEQKDYYVTHKIRAKGGGREGKVRVFHFDDAAMQAIQKWLEVRGEDDCPYVFVSKTANATRQLSANTFNLWCEHFSKILGKKVFPHLLRSSRATNAVVEEGRGVKAVQQLLGHASSETTEIYIVRDDSDDLDELF